MIVRVVSRAVDIEVPGYLAGIEQAAVMQPLQGKALAGLGRIVPTAALVGRGRVKRLVWPVAVVQPLGSVSRSRPSANSSSPSGRYSLPVRYSFGGSAKWSRMASANKRRAGCRALGPGAFDAPQQCRDFRCSNRHCLDRRGSRRYMSSNGARRKLKSE